MPMLTIETDRREQFLDITDQVRAALREQGSGSGICTVFSPHTTCGVTVNEGHDPDVAADAVRHLGELVPRFRGWRHGEGNSDAHVKTILVGASVTLPLEGGKLALGQWQRVFLCEFDGPRRRQVRVTVLAG
ncbi:MAG: YjbQ family protein [Candidatus Dormibacteraeota bacterium]|nr:YjbQ family protein [Candidatus Dormibacteraeota bacterium]